MRGLLIIAAILYVVSPVDFLPDVIPVLGWLDDIGVLGLLATALMSGGPKKFGR